jgi:Transglutaminase-like superfamily
MLLLLLLLSVSGASSWLPDKVSFLRRRFSALPFLSASTTRMASTTSNSNDNNDDNNSNNKFEQKLRYNVDRFAKILLDEQQQQLVNDNDNNNSNNNDNEPLLEWLQASYGEIQQLHAANLLSPQQTVEDQKSSLLHFLEWFRREFPYYRDTCDHCHASGCRQQQEEEEEGNHHNPTSTPPDDEELAGIIAVDETELLWCDKCQKVTRFPRHLSAMEIVRRRKGRCSEYSLLLYRILRGLGLRARWIVDWDNHVWTEVWMDDRWVHLDPCEASLDRPLLYQQGWGKKQTYIVAFSEGNDPSSTHDVPVDHATTTTSTTGAGWNHLRSVVDVTKDYTSDTLDVIQTRRTQDGVTQQAVASALERANADLKRMTLAELISSYRKV